MDELIYELSAPLRGVGSDILVRFFINSILIPFLTVFVYCLFSILLKKRLPTWTPLAFTGIAALFALNVFIVFWNRVDAGNYFKYLSQDSTFIEENYADAGEVNIVFPEKKRNLIYVFLESVETTYSDYENGGGFSFNCIPELTEMAEKYECFSANKKINGGYVLNGTTWTMGGMFAQTTGLPLKTNINENNMQYQKKFFPGVTALGDILKKEGYNQVLLLGSDVEFGGRRVFFSNHGDYQMLDYPYAKNNNWIPKDYYVWWGYEDEKLFEYARNELLELNREGAPFNLTMLTVDTHFEDGYYCHLCRDEFEGNQYADVMACSSRQVSAFIDWVQHQDFYENTTIILNGDHTTMDLDFCNDVPENYDRKAYTVIINPATEKVRKNENIEYSTLDMYPTTLAAMGIKIDGEKLGLGVNLFSDKKTLIEEYGVETVNKEFGKNSFFMRKLSGVNLEDEDVKQRQGWLPDCDLYVASYDPVKETIEVKADNIINVEKIKHVYATLYDRDGKKLKKKKMNKNPDRSYLCSFEIRGLDRRIGSVEVTAVADEKYQVGILKGDLSVQAHESFVDYVNLLRNRDDIALLLAIRGEATEYADGIVLNSLRSLGIYEPLYGRGGIALYAVKDQNGTVYGTDPEGCEYDGTFGDGTEYHVASYSKNSDNTCSIEINGKEYAINERGLNIVVYDYSSQSVVDSVSFDISPSYGMIFNCDVNVDIIGKQAVISVTDILGRNLSDDIDNALGRGVIWDDGSEPKSFELANMGDGTMRAEFSLDKIDINDCYLELYISDVRFLKEK
ncbi:MAG: LTA synthase family protein, partial [Lachnospiraceae bacterium]|nr:LTA synthase family protein [Lachnospiraceae bacterium]